MRAPPSPRRLPESAPLLTTCPPLSPGGGESDVLWVLRLSPGAVGMGKAFVRGLLLWGSTTQGSTAEALPAQEEPGGMVASPSNLREAPTASPNHVWCPAGYEQETNSPSAQGSPAGQEGCRGHVVGVHVLLGQAQRSTCTSSPESSGLSGRGALYHPHTYAHSPRSGNVLKATWLVSGRVRIQTQDSAHLSPTLTTCLVTQGRGWCAPMGLAEGRGRG